MDITARAADLEAHIEAARAVGDIAALLAMAQPGLDRLVATSADVPESDRAAVMKVARRIAYNVAADVWPGWELGVTRSDEELAAGRHLAELSRGIVEQMDEGTLQRGHAAWLVGAFDLAQGDHNAARQKFRAAAEFFKDAPDMRLLAEGYSAIAAECAGGASGVAATVAALDDLGTEDAQFHRDQLLVAREVFVRHMGAV